MENDQSTQQQSQSDDSKLLRQRRFKALSSPQPTLINLCKRYPWLIWSGVWALLLSTAAFVSSVAIFSLVHTGYVAHEEPQPATARERDSSQTTPVNLLWVLGAVALTCSVGYLASKHLKGSLRAKDPQQSKQKRLRRRQRPISQLPPPTLVEPSPVAEAEPVVTVLPPEENNPLDKHEESLAEMMDIRKQQSLSAILGDVHKE